MIRFFDCEHHGAGSGAELFLVEGDSAARAVRRVCDARYQAVLAMRGKPLNAWKSTREGMLRHETYRLLLDALGVGAPPAADVASCRFERILLLCDPDADGAHCAMLVLLFFYRWLRPLLDEGRVWTVVAPQYERRDLVPDQPTFAFSETQVRQHRLLQPSGTGPWQRIRGLASLSDMALRETCVDMISRHLLPLSAKDAESALVIFQRRTTRS
jgi:DNA gyrase/topoisomerase IV subunit B